MIKKYISLSIILIFILACATVQNPTGGQKDNKAPILYESNPKDQSTNFKGTEIKLFFNEWMKLEQINKELIITPREDIKYEATLKKQDLTIKLKEPLKDSTTYTFNFRKALKDITEGNLWQNPVIAFSTGDYLDSLEIQGSVNQLMTQAPAKEYLVGLYNANIDTANLRQGKPVYFTTTDDKGNFKMQNLKKGKYLLYSFQDKNDNLINNSQTEPYGFYAETIHLKDTLPSITIRTYQNNEDTLTLKKYSPVGKDFIIQYNKGLSSYKITNKQDSNQYIYTNDVEQSKYLRIYKENFPKLAYEQDSVELFVEVKDSINQSRLDTVFLKIRESRIKNDEINIIKKPNAKIISGPQNFKYSLSKPVYQINYDSIQLRIDTIPIKIFQKDEIHLNFNKKEIDLHTVITQKEISIIIDSLKSAADSIRSLKDSLRNTTDSTRNEIDTARNNRKSSDIDKKGRQNLETTNTESTLETRSIAGRQNLPTSSNSQNTSKFKLQLYLGRGAFVGIESDSTTKNITTIDFKKAEEYGIIKGKVEGLESDYIIQLLSDKYEVIDTLINKGEYQFNYVQPGSYRLRLIEDKNGNAKWDPGNPLILKPQEAIYYLDELITVKANWEVIDKNFLINVDNSVNDSGEK